MKKYKFSGFDEFTHAIFKTDNNEKIKRKMYKTPKNLSYLGKNYILWNGKEYYFNNSIPFALTK